MRTSPVLSALGAGTLAFGLAIAAAPGALAADPERTTPAVDTPATADSLLAAMERDLGLSPHGAGELLKAQEEAFGLGRAAARAAGDAYGGSVFDTDTQELTVLVTDPAAAAAVEAVGAVPRVVDHGAEGLDAVVAELNEAAEAAPSDATGWYTDAESDTVVIEVMEGGDADALIDAAGIDASAVTVTEVSERPELLNEIAGGLPYYASSGRRCSMGFTAFDSFDRVGFVTAGHCGTVGTTVTFGSGGTGRFDYSSSGSDGAFVRATSIVRAYPGIYRHSEGDYVAVRGSSEAPIGASVCRSGFTTGWRCGTIQAKNQTVLYPQGMVRGLTRTNVCSEPGDSGGPFITSDQAQGVTSGGSGNCASGGTTFFQPLNPLLRAWNLRLATV
ncbi:MULTISPECIES: S1 family peptidase [unclassified Nocardiopsis]|uniref:S1 family peptidase n=1 Tax=unclassified Nocardiopsis TaxID=2649073 RepID=UPI00135B153E|nr:MULTISPECIES: S1 family peptidase [unclassified Nocardiopsis]